MMRRHEKSYIFSYVGIIRIRSQVGTDMVPSQPESIELPTYCFFILFQKVFFVNRKIKNCLR